jgi:ABC-type nitrate/sulfonate/bicarbonate transport system permease component
VDRRYRKRPACTEIGVSRALVWIGAGIAAGAGSGRACRTAEFSHRLNIPGMYAALLLLSEAGIGIYTLLAPVSHPVLRRWRASALGKENGWLRVFRRKRLIC